MRERRKRIMKRLLIEELESRAMLNGTEIAMAATSLTTNSYQDFYKSQVGTEIGGPGGVGMLDSLLVDPQLFVELAANVMNMGNAAATFPEATTGVGQMTITTGANTLGISSFAYPTAGPSRAGGTGNANLGSPTGPVEANAVDQAILELQLELPSLALAKRSHDAQQDDTARAEQEDAAEEQSDSQYEEESRNWDRELVAAYD